MPIRFVDKIRATHYRLWLRFYAFYFMEKIPDKTVAGSKQEVAKSHEEIAKAHQGIPIVPVQKLIPV